MKTLTLILIVLVMTTLTVILPSVLLYYIVKPVFVKGEDERRQAGSEARKQKVISFVRRHPKLLLTLKIISAPFVIAYAIVKGILKIVEALAEGIGSILLFLLLVFLAIAFWPITLILMLLG